jgi:hypothetical protein
VTSPDRSRSDPAEGAPAANESDCDDRAGAADDAELRSMRAVWLEMRDEEPSGRGLGDLLAAARAKAVTMVPRPSWWQRLIASLRRPPALALATAMVLIAGAAIFGRRALDAPPRVEVVEPKRPETRADRIDAEAPVAPTVSAGDRDGAALQTAQPTGQHSDVGGRAVVRAKAAAEVAPAPSPESPPPSANEQAPAVPEAAGAAAMLSQVEEPAAAAAPARGELAKLQQQCEAAARRGDCPAVRQLVDQITRSDRGYRRRMAKDSPVAKCLAE